MQSLEYILADSFKVTPEDSGEFWLVPLTPAQWAMRKSLAQELNKQNISFELKNEKLLIRKSALLGEMNVPVCFDKKMQELLTGKVSLEIFFKAYPEPVHLADVGDYIEELTLRGLIFDFNDVENSDSIVGIDAEDRVKFIQANKFYFEEDLKNLIDSLVKKAQSQEVIHFIQQKIRPKIISSDKVKDSDYEHYAHLLDYLASDKFESEIGLAGLYGATLQAIEERVRKWSQIKLTRVMDDPKGVISVYEVDNYMWYELTTPQSLDFESFIMGHCVGQGGYDKGVAEGRIKIYSLRDTKNQPHCTIELREGHLAQIKGIKNGTILPKYRKACASFIKNYLQKDLNSLSESHLRYFLCIKVDKQAMPATFFDPTHLNHFLAGQRASQTEILLKEMIRAEADIFNYDVEVVYKKVIALMNKSGLIPHDTEDILVQKDEYKKIQDLLRQTKIERESIPYQPLSLLEKIYTLSQLRTWSIEYLKGLLSKKKYSEHRDNILRLAGFIANQLGFNDMEFIDELFKGQIDPYKTTTNSDIQIFWFEDLIQTIKEFEAQSVSFPNTKNISMDVSSGSCGCEDCGNDKIMDSVQKIEADAAREIDSLIENLSQLEAFNDTLDEVMATAKSTMEGMVSDIDCNILEYIKSENPSDEEFIENLKHCLVGQLEALEEPFGKKVADNFSYGRRYSVERMKFGDFSSLPSTIAKQQKELESYASDIAGCFSDMDNCDCVKGRFDASFNGFDSGDYEAIEEKMSQISSYEKDVAELTAEKIEKRALEFLNNLKEEGTVTKLFSE